MKNPFIVKFAILSIYFVSVIYVGNVYFASTWRPIAEMLQIIHMCVVIYLSIRIFNKMDLANKTLFKWFVLSNIFLTLSSILYVIIARVLNININHLIALIYLIPAFLWITAALIFWGIITIRHLQIKNNWLVIVAILLIDVCLSHILSDLPLKPITEISITYIIFHMYANIVSIFILNFALYVLMCSNNMGLRILSAGAISIIGASFLTTYIIYTYNPSNLIYRNEFWLFSSCIFISGLMFLKSSPKIDIGNFPKTLSIKNVITAWTLTIIVLTAAMFIGLIHYFHVISTHMLSILPYLMFIYIIFAVFTSLFISYIFEEPIKIINETLQNFIEHPKEHTQNKINIEEFAVLNDFLHYTMQIIDERNSLQEFRKVVNQVSHDIRSPIASLLTFAKGHKALPEEERIALREIATRITDIANNLLARYEPNDSFTKHKTEQKEPLLISAAIAQILSEKRSQFHNKNIRFEFQSNQESNFAFINIEANSFKRMLSNLINNSVEALEMKHGIVTISLVKIADEIQIMVEDNGKGIPQKIINKIMNNIAVTSDKTDGYGIGYTQIREALQRNDGMLSIESNIGQGTKVTVSFPEINAPLWFANQISLNYDDLVIILDDDPSIHNAWASRFKIDAPDLKLKHFTSGQDAIDFINNETTTEKEHIFLLSDFELLEQNITGLDVIKQTGINRSMLVTSHHNNKNLQSLALKNNTKILPKTLAVDVLISLKKEVEVNDQKQVTPSLKKTDIVFIDDDTKLVTMLKSAFFSDKNVDIWNDPSDFMSNYTQYPLDTKICMDINFSNSDLNGINLAKQLYNAGFSKLYLISGDKFAETEIPDYLNFILKTDIESIQKLGNN